MNKWLILVLAALLLVGCSRVQASDGEVILEPVKATQGTVAAEGEIEPARWAELRFEGGGTVVEVAVQEGDPVTADDLLVRFDTTDAELAVQQAEAALERTEIRAPFAGTVVEVTVDAGDTARPDEVVVVLATLDHLQAVTVDLTELDVARVTEGQAATVTVDALPGVELAGHVDRIGLRAQDYRGDVVYPVVVALEEGVPGLRWGMTTMVKVGGESGRE